MPWVLSHWVEVGANKWHGFGVMDIGAMSHVSGCLRNSGKARKIDFVGLIHWFVLCSLGHHNAVACMDTW